MKYADLHVHTTYSDSTLTPEELVKKTKLAGLDCVAVVDHDTVEGIVPSIDAGLCCGIEVLPGIELSCDFNNAEVHILGYLVDITNPTLLATLADIRKIRLDRMYEMTVKLKDLGVNIAPEEVFALANTQNIGRLHLAQVLLKRGYVKTISEAFYRYIGDRSPAYVCGFKLSPQKAMHLIKEAGGVPVLAHPYILGNDDVIPVFVDDGLMGIEVFYPEHSASKTEHYKNMAAKYNLLMTGGSDCHGAAKPDVVMGAIKIPYTLVEKLKEAKENI